MCQNHEKFTKYSEQHFQFLSDEIPEMDTLRELVVHLVDGFTLADLGCGDGRVLFALDRLGVLDHAHVVLAVDLSPTRIYSLSDILKVAGICSNVSSLPIEDSTVDFVISTQVIEHVEDDHVFVQEIQRILKPGGAFLVSSVLKAWYGFYFYRNQNGKFVLDPTHVREYRCTDEIRQLFRTSAPLLDLTLVRTSPCRFPITDLILHGLVKAKVLKQPSLVRSVYRQIPSLRFVRRWLKIPIPGYSTVVVTGIKME